MRCLFSESAERRCVVCSLKRCDGNTIHHACGIPVNRRGDGNDDHLQRQQDIAKRVVQWRWLSIDEISVVSIWLSCARQNLLNENSTTLSRNVCSEVYY